MDSLEGPALPPPLPLPGTLRTLPPLPPPPLLLKGLGATTRLGAGLGRAMRMRAAERRGTYILPVLDAASPTCHVSRVMRR